MKRVLGISKLFACFLVAISLKAQSATPIVTSFLPTSVQAGSNAFTLTVNGSNFFVGNVVLVWTPPGATVPLGAITPIAGASSTVLQFSIPATAIATAGTAAFVIRNQLTTAFDSAVQNVTVTPAPSISSISPTTVAAGSGAFTLTVNGANFDLFFPICTFSCPPVTPTIIFNGIPLVSTYVSANQLTVTIPATYIISGGAVGVTVQNPGGSASNTATFLIAAPPPVISSLNPSSVRVGSAGITLRVLGTNFDEGMTVRWNGSSLSTTSIGTTELDATVPANLLAQAGNFNITVATFNNTYVTPPSVFTVVPQPGITLLSPSFAIAGDAAFNLTVTGSSFDAGSRVRWNNTNLTTTFVNASQLIAAVSAPLIATQGSAAITVATSDGGVSAPRQFPIYARLQITTGAIPGLTTEVNYSTTITAVGGISPYFWAASGLPNGLSINSATGVISGATQSTGSFDVTVIVTDGSQQTATARYSIVVDRFVPPLEIITTAVPPGVAGTAYNTSFGAQGGAGNYSFAISQGALPAGLTLSAAGVLSGTPTVSGQFRFTVTVTDSERRTASTSFVLTIAPGPLTVTGTLADLQVGAAVNVQFGATGGVPPYTFAVSGTVPAGTTFSNGTLAGTVNSVGTFQFTVVATDSQGTVANKAFIVTVTVPSLKVTGTAGNGQVGVAYSAQFGATGGAPPYTFTATGLPAGVQLSGTSLSGTPTTAGTFTVAITATDSAGAKATSNFPVQIAPAGLAVTTSSLPNGTLGSAYSASLAATGGSPPYTWAVTGTPAGVTASSAGALSGTPTQAGAFTVNATVTDAARATASRSFTVTIAMSPLTVTTTSLPAPTLGVAFTGSLSASGGIPPLTWTASGLPTGISLSTAGVFSGTPTSAGTSSITATVTDSTGATASRSFNVTITLLTAPSVNVTGLPANANPGSQQSLQVGLTDSYPVEVSVTATLGFAADSGPDDPAVQFAGGGRTMQLLIPAGSTAPSTNIGLQTGTVAGTITITFRLSAATADVTPTPVPVRTVRLNPSAPVIASATAVRNANGFIVTLTGFSSSRDMTQGSFQFNPAAGSTLQTTQLTVPVDALFSQYYGSSAAAPFGSQFTLTQPFNVQGSSTSIQSVTVMLVNRIGNSNAITVNLQ